MAQWLRGKPFVAKGPLRPGVFNEGYRRLAANAREIKKAAEKAAGKTETAPAASAE